MHDGIHLTFWEEADFHRIRLETANFVSEFEIPRRLAEHRNAIDYFLGVNVHVSETYFRRVRYGTYWKNVRSRCAF